MGRLPLTRELSAKLTEGETDAAAASRGRPAYLSLRLGFAEPPPFTQGRHFRGPNARVLLTRALQS